MAKREMGQVIKRGERTYLVRVYKGRDANGKRKYHSKTIHGTEKEAYRYRNKVLTDIQAGTFVEPSKVALAAYLREWLEKRAKNKVRAATLRDYRYHIESYIIPALGVRKLSDLQPMEIQGFYNDLSDRGLSPRTVRYIHSTLRSALGQAMKWGMISRNPADAELVDLPRLERKELQVWTPEQLKTFLEKASKTRWYSLWLLLATTGLRPCEALALRWSDVEEGTVRVRRSLVRLKGGHRFEDTKTKGSRRSVPLPQPTVAALKMLRKTQAKERLAAGREYDPESNLVFAGRVGNPLDYSVVVRRHFKPLVKEAGVPLISPYGLRHTHATHLLLSGVHPKVVAERLGHAKVGMTLDTYTHVLPGLQEEATAKVEKLLFG